MTKILRQFGFAHIANPSKFLIAAQAAARLPQCVREQRKRDVLSRQVRAEIRLARRVQATERNLAMFLVGSTLVSIIGLVFLLGPFAKI